MNHRMELSAAFTVLKFRLQDITVYPKVTAIVIIFLAEATLRRLLFYL